MAEVTRPPDTFGDEFLEWLRDATERAWSTGIDSAWSTDTRWLGGLTAVEIESIENRWSVRFPPDYRLFLRTLHAPDQRMARSRFVSRTETERILVPTFFNWKLDTEEVASAFDWPFEGFKFDVEHGQLWPRSWGERPADVQAQIQEMRKRLDQAPRLVPVTGHRYLLGIPCVAGNPVLSVYQSDIIVYGADIRQFLLNEFAPLLGLQPDFSKDVDVAAIPFWGEIILGG